MRTLIVGAALLFASGACGGDKPAFEGCPDDVPTSCPNPEPGFAAKVAPLVRDHCAKCHGPTGTEPGVPFQTYDQIQAFSVGILVQVRDCVMPPLEEPVLTSSQRQTLLGWIVCGAKNN